MESVLALLVVLVKPVVPLMAVVVLAKPEHVPPTIHAITEHVRRFVTLVPVPEVIGLQSINVRPMAGVVPAVVVKVFKTI